MENKYKEIGFQIDNDNRLHIIQFVMVLCANDKKDLVYMLRKFEEEYAKCTKRIAQ